MTQGSNFQVDFDGVNRGTRYIQDLSAYAQRIGDDFRMSTSDLRWTGTDSYGRQLREKYEASVSATQDTIDAISDGVRGIGDGLLANLREARTTQGSVIDDIGAHGTAYRR